MHNRAKLHVSAIGGGGGGGVSYHVLMVLVMSKNLADSRDCRV